METEIVAGIHSIVQALLNPVRSNFHLHATKDSFNKLKSQSHEVQEKLGDIVTSYYDGHGLQEMAKKLFVEKGQKYFRIQGGMLLECSALPIFDTRWALQEIKKREAPKIMCLDQVTDVHNMAAILRSACFYGIDMCVLSSKKKFAPGAQFFRVSAGASEHVPLVSCQNLAKFIAKLTASGIFCVGLSEHAESFQLNPKNFENGLCFVLGAEDKGLSHAVDRVLPHKLALIGNKGRGSLNVSVAAAVMMERYKAHH